jgi:hypothetical protein
MKTSELIALVKDLEECDHLFLTPEGAEHFLKPFGLKPILRVAQDTSSEFKGLTLHDDQGHPLKEAEGEDGLDVASQIADHFKLNVPDFFGRGSQHQAYCEAIIAHLEKQKTSRKSEV